MQHVSHLHSKFTLRPHHVRSMVDIQSATAEIWRGNNKKEGEEESIHSCKILCPHLLRRAAIKSGGDMGRGQARPAGSQLGARADSAGGPVLGEKQRVTAHQLGGLGALKAPPVWSAGAIWPGNGPWLRQSRH